jgi:hypothetical protein
VGKERKEFDIGKFMGPDIGSDWRTEQNCVKRWAKEQKYPNDTILDEDATISKPICAVWKKSPKTNPTYQPPEPEPSPTVPTPGPGGPSGPGSPATPEKGGESAGAEPNAEPSAVPDTCRRLHSIVGESEDGESEGVGEDCGEPSTEEGIGAGQGEI